jgi:hypothetical protein
MRKKVSLQDMSTYLGVHAVHSLLAGQLPPNCKEGLIWKDLQDSAEYVESETDPDVLTTDSMSFFDPRHRSLGGRIICPSESLEVELDKFTVKDDVKEYHTLRHLYGIAEV